MKKITILFFVAVMTACSSTKHTSSTTSTTTQPTEGADGSSYEKAIVITEKHETAGVNAEYKWVSDHYPGYKRKSQSLNYNNNKPYDILTVTTADGTEKKVYFDISNFFGKF